MKKSQKIIIGIILILFLASFGAVKTAKAATIEDIKAQIVILLAKIAEIQKQLDELIKSESGAEKSIALVSPNGGEIWQNGGIYEIKWTSSGYSSDEKVKIAILDGRRQTTSVDYELDVADTTNSGLYSWTIPLKSEGFALYGGLYKIIVYIGEGASQKSAVSQSYFTISLPVPAYLNLISPNGGEILQTGTSYTIKWDSLGMENYKIKIILKSNEIVYAVIADNIIPNRNFYEWTISQNLYGSGYKIQIEAYNEYGSLVGQAVSNNNFTIIQKVSMEKLKSQLASIGAIIDSLKNAIISLIKR